MKIGVLGNGKLGSLLLRRDGFFPLKCNLNKIDTIEKEVNSVQPDLIVNLAGISSVEECEKNYPKAIQVNVNGTSNLHKVFGDRVLTVSSDHVFNGKSCRNTEYSTLAPINNYGFTKVGAEAVSNIYDGKIIRLSRTVSIEDGDISDWLLRMYKGEQIHVPTFIYRNFIHRQFAVDGIEYFSLNYDRLPRIVHYAGLDNYSFYNFMLLVADEFGFDRQLVVQRKEDNPSYAPRPMNGGFRVKLAKGLKFPMYSIGDTVSRLFKETT